MKKRIALAGPLAALAALGCAVVTFHPDPAVKIHNDRSFCESQAADLKIPLIYAPNWVRRCMWDQ